MALKKLILMMILGLQVGGCKAPEEGLIPLADELPAPTAIELDLLNYQPGSGNRLRNIFVSNFSVIVSQGSAQLSTAMDGISDVFKANQGVDYNFSLTSAYSGTLGINNLILYLTGIIPTIGPTFCSAASQASGCTTATKNYVYNCANDGFYFKSSVDSSDVFLGLTDCEKRFIHLDINSFDTNGNGVPDVLKIRCGMNPRDTADGSVSISNDSFSNIEKCKMHLPFDESGDTAFNQAYAYGYKFSMNVDGTSNIAVSNIAILDGGVGNFIAIYIVEYSPTTNQEFLSSAFLILDDFLVHASPIQIPYWGLKTNVNLSL